MSTPEKQAKVAELIKNADLYDLIKISMKTSDNKISAVDRYIKRALDRQMNQTQSTVEEPDWSNSPLQADNKKYMYHRRSPTHVSEKASQLEPEVHIVEHNVRSQRQSVKASPVKSQKSQKSVLSSPNQSPRVKTPQSLTKKSYLEDLPREYTFSPEKSSSKTNTDSFMKLEPIPVTCNMEQFIKQNIESSNPSPQKYHAPEPITNISYIQQANENDYSNNEITQNLQQLREVGLTENLYYTQAKEKTPSRQSYSRGNYSKQTVSSTQKQKSLLLDEMLPNDSSNQKLERSDSKQYQSRTQAPYYNSNKSLGRSASTNILSRDIEKKLGTVLQTVIANTGNQRNSSINSKRCTTNQTLVLESRKAFNSKQDCTMDNTVSNSRLQNESSTLKSASKLFRLSHQKTYEEMVQKQVQKVTSKFLKKPQNKKQIMLKSFNDINLSVFVEIARIKKPQKHAFQAGRMLCLLVNSFRDRPETEDFDNWAKVQCFTNQNVNKFTQEVMHLKVKTQEPSLPIHVELLKSFHDEFFQTTPLQTYKSHITNKQLFSIATLVHNVLDFILSREGVIDNEKVESQIGIFDNQSVTESVVPSSGITNDETPRSSNKDPYEYLTQACSSPFEINATMKSNAVVMMQPSQTKVSQKQSLKSNISPKPKFITKTTSSPFRIPSKNKFCKQAIELVPQEKKYKFAQLNTDAVKAKSKGKERPSTKMVENQNMTQHMYTVKEELSSTKTTAFSNISNKLNDPSKTSRNSIPGRSSSKNSIATTRKASQNPKSPVTTTSIVKDRRSSRSPLGNEFNSTSQLQQRVQQSHQKLKEEPEVLKSIAVEDVDQEKEFEFSPSRVRKVIAESRSEINQMIIDKSYQIEENMSFQKNISKEKHIDISIIEELKRRRAGQQRLRGEELDQRREMIIQQVQKQFLTDSQY